MHILFLLFLCRSFGVWIWLLLSFIIITSFRVLSQNPKAYATEAGLPGIEACSDFKPEIPKMAEPIRPYLAQKGLKYQNQLCISQITILN